MGDRKEMLQFAEKWLGLFREHRIENLEFENDFGDACERFGWIMDMGEIFSDATGCRLFDTQMLEVCYDGIVSTDIAGSALYSSWRAFTHWMESDLDEPRVRVWFIALLEKLCSLVGGSRKDDSITLPPHKLQLVSFRRLSLPSVEDDEVEQHITLNDRGMAYVSVFSRDEQWNKEPVSKKTVGVGRIRAVEMLEAFASVFSFTEVDDMVSFDASWALVLTDRNGKKYKYASSMVPYGILPDLTSLSEDMRTLLSDPSLMVLDGECGPDEMESLDVTYSTGGDDDTRETISLDREFETLTYEKTSGTDYRAKREWRVGDEVSAILDELYDE